MACELHPGTCRRKHIAPHLDDAKEDGGDFEARCPRCGHDTFRISRPERSKRYRHIWVCACRTCGCKPDLLRAVLLGRDIDRRCLGTYDGNTIKVIDSEAAARQELAIRDIISAPGLKPSDIRLVLAEALGWKVPTDYTEFVRFAKRAGVGHQQAYEAARRWVGRPSDGRPQTGGGVVDTSRTTEPGADVKPIRSEVHKPTETVESGYENRSEGRESWATETVAPMDAAVRNLRDAGLTGGNEAA